MDVACSSYLGLEGKNLDFRSGNRLRPYSDSCVCGERNVHECDRCTQTSIAGAEIEHQNKTGPERTVRYITCVSGVEVSYFRAP